jgi:photosystem II stability/assembly factor-like uncharacterized protein
MIKAFTLVLLTLLLIGAQDARADWARQNTNSFAWYHDVFFVDQSKGWIVGSDGAMLSTDDGGQSWRQLKKFTTDSFIQIHFTSETTGWLLCERNPFARGANATSYLRKTVDGGRTWDKIEFLDGGRERVTRLLFNTDGTATAFGEGGVFYRLQEDGVSWKRTQTAIHFLLLDGTFANENIGAIVGTGGTILFTEDSGLTWERASLLGDTDARINSVYFTGPKHGIAVGSKGRVFRATGGGRLWRQQDSGTRLNLTDVIFTNQMNGWAIGDDGIVIRTRDGGMTWNDVDSHVTHRLEKIVFVGDRGWAVGYGGTVITYDPKTSTPDQGNKPTLLKRN